jgi:hypothetical protein
VAAPDGLISRLRSVFNLAEASQQLGLMSARGSRAQRIAAALRRVETRFSAAERGPARRGAARPSRSRSPDAGS